MISFLRASFTQLLCLALVFSPVANAKSKDRYLTENEYKGILKDISDIQTVKELIARVQKTNKSKANELKQYLIKYSIPENYKVPKLLVKNKRLYLSEKVSLIFSLDGDTEVHYNSKKVIFKKSLAFEEMHKKVEELINSPSAFSFNSFLISEAYAQFDPLSISVGVLIAIAIIAIAPLAYTIASLRAINLQDFAIVKNNICIRLKNENAMSLENLQDHHKQLSEMFAKRCVNDIHFSNLYKYACKALQDAKICFQEAVAQTPAINGNDRNERKEVPNQDSPEVKKVNSTAQ